MVMMMLGMTGSLTMNVIADTARITTITGGGDMARGVGVIIRNDFHYGDNVKAYLKSTIDRLTPYYPEYDIVEGDEILHFCSRESDSCPFSLLLANGFWYVIDGFCLLHLFHRRCYKFKLQTYDLALALGQKEVWYCSEYTLDSVCLEYSFEEFLETAKQCEMLEYFEGMEDEYDTSFFHEEIKAHPLTKKKFNVLIIGDEAPVIKSAEKHGVNLTFLELDAHQKYYQFTVDDDGLNWHPFLREMYRFDCVFGMWWHRDDE